ncbi:uncharacterized protein LOC117115514, partial [Anneissia japonica]|uniref:uncharacterized protein LOC117115514 n=1 Tax=Anneissia japonica TaxID=1529436 RepID=UPI001425657F
LIITAFSTNGGYLRLNKYEYSTTPTVSERTYYQGTSVTRSLNIIIDLEGPRHCSLTVPRDVFCTGYALEIEYPYTKLSELEIRWSTWVDDVSGMTTMPYDLRVCKMVAKNDVLDFDDNVVCLRLDHSRIGDDYEAKFNPTLP